MDLTSLEQFHQRKGYDETDSGPFEASQSDLKHPGRIVAQATPLLNWRKSRRRGTGPCFSAGLVSGRRPGAIRYFPPSLLVYKCIDCAPDGSLGSPHDKKNPNPLPCNQSRQCLGR